MLVLYVLETCPYCNQALNVLNQNKIKYKSIVVENTEEAKRYYKKQNKMDTFPQIFIQESKDNFIKIGGYDNLMDLLNICNNIRSSEISMNAVLHMYKILYRK
jgi:glutaredoxin